MKKAERIFWSTYSECFYLFESHGFQYNPDGKAIGFCSLCTSETTSTRTHNAIQKIINRIIDRTKTDYELSVINANEYKKELYLLEMVKSTLNNHIAANE